MLSIDHVGRNANGGADGGQYEIDRSDLASRIYQVLKSKILSGELAPGQRLSLDEFAQYFDVSVTPIRDALRLLAAEGLVDLKQRRGAFVAQPSTDDIRQVYQLRELLECAAVEHAVAAGAGWLEEIECLLDAMAATNVGDSHKDYLAYIHLDQCFHQALIDTVGNRKLSEIYASLGSFTLVTLVLCHEREQRAIGTLDEHRTIVEALRAGSVGEACAAIRTHLRNAAEDLARRIAA